MVHQPWTIYIHISRNKTTRKQNWLYGKEHNINLITLQQVRIRKCNAKQQILTYMYVAECEGFGLINLQLVFFCQCMTSMTDTFKETTRISTALLTLVSANMLLEISSTQLEWLNVKPVVHMSSL